MQHQVLILRGILGRVMPQRLNSFLSLNSLSVTALFGAFPHLIFTSSQECQSKQEKKIIAPYTFWPSSDLLCFRREYCAVGAVGRTYLDSRDTPHVNYTFDLKDMTDIICSKLLSNILSILGPLNHLWLVKTDASFITPIQLAPLSLFFFYHCSFCCLLCLR